MIFIRQLTFKIRGIITGPFVKLSIMVSHRINIHTSINIQDVRQNYWTICYAVNRGVTQNQYSKYNINP